MLCADEKTSIQARKRCAPGRRPAPGLLRRVEHEYERKGAWAYLAAWDVRHARVHGRCELKTGIAPFERLVEQVMAQEPYRSAQHVFWIVDNGSSHRGESSDEASSSVRRSGLRFAPMARPVWMAWVVGAWLAPGSAGAAVLIVDRLGTPDVMQAGDSMSFAFQFEPDEIVLAAQAEISATHLTGFEFTRAQGTWDLSSTFRFNGEGHPMSRLQWLANPNPFSKAVSVAVGRRESWKGSPVS